MIREMKRDDWTAMMRIYRQSLEKGNITFTTEENIAKDRFGQWQSTTIMERRNGIL